MRRPWLLPFAPIYWVITSIRNALFDIGILKSREFPIPIICVGNLSAGGTGKTPHTEWILHHFSSKYDIAVLSRGYGRKTKGFLAVTSKSKARDVGDEPLQIAQRFPDAQVVVCENRVFGVEMLLSGERKPDVIVLDDAYQHRYVSPGLTWLLTAWDDLYTRDFMLPLGNLREDIRGADRADIITVTKCPGEPTPLERDTLRSEINPTELQTLSFSRMKYAPLVTPSGEQVEKPSNAVVVTGIAKPEPLLSYLNGIGVTCTPLVFPDHHAFTHADGERIVNAFSKNQAEYIITTRKDFVRWPEDNAELNALPLLIQDINIDLGHDQGPVLRNIDRFLADFAREEE